MRWIDFITLWLATTVIYIGIPNKPLCFGVCLLLGAGFGIYRGTHPWKEDK